MTFIEATIYASALPVFWQIVKYVRYRLDRVKTVRRRNQTMYFDQIRKPADSDGPSECTQKKTQTGV